MAITNVGFTGTVDAAAWSGLAVGIGTDYSVDDASNLRVSQVAGNRRVSIAAGFATGRGVRTRLSTAEPKDIPAPAAGRWYLLVLRRVWSELGGSATIELLGHSTTTATVPGTYPLDWRVVPNLQKNPGVSDDQPIAWVWANNSSTDVQIVHLTVPVRSALGESFSSDAARDAYYGVPTGPLDALRLQHRAVNAARMDKGYVERYFAVKDSVANPGGAWIAGWYPVDGNLPHFAATTSGLSVQNENELEIVGGTWVYNDEYGFQRQPGDKRFYPPVPGWYLCAGRAQFANNPNGFRMFSVLRNFGGVAAGSPRGPNLPFPNEAKIAHPAAALGNGHIAVAQMLWFNGTTDYFSMSVYQSSGAAMTGGVNQNPLFSLSATYVRP